MGSTALAVVARLTDQWDIHKDTIYDLYIKQNLPLKAVRRELGKQSFSASVPQYKRKLNEWGFVKNHKSSQWQAISRGLDRRGLGATTARVTIQGVEMSADQVGRALRRHDRPSLKRKFQQVDSPLTPENVRIRKGFSRDSVTPYAMLIHPVLNLPGLQLIEETRGPVGLSNVLYPQPEEHLDVGVIGWHAGRAALYLPQQDPDLIVGDIESRLCAPELVVDHVFISYVTYLISNKLLHEIPFDRLMAVLLDMHRMTLLTCFTQLGLMHLRLFEQQLLLYAARHGRVDLLELLVSRKIELSRPINCDGEPRTALQEAISHRQAAFSRALIELGVDVDVFEGPDDTSDEYWYHNPLFMAIHFLPEIFPILVERTETSNLGKYLPLAVEMDLDTDTIVGLLHRGADVNTVDRDLQTALHYAIVNHNNTLAELLLEEGACPNGPSRPALVRGFATFCKDGKSDLTVRGCIDTQVLFRAPLAQAVVVGDHKMCERLIEAGANVSSTLHERLIPSMARDVVLPTNPTYEDISLVDGLVEPEEIFNSLRDSTSESGTESTSDSMSDSMMDDMMEELMDQMKDELDMAMDQAVDEMVVLDNAWDSWDSTTLPLVLAAFDGKAETMQLLLGAGAEPSERDGFLERTDALQAASHGGHVQMIMMLLEGGADINSPAAGLHGRTALQYAAEGGHLDAAMVLLNHGADINAQCADDCGLTALQAAVFSDNELLVNLLLSRGADVNAAAAARGGYTALSMAIRKNSPTMFKKLVKAGARIDIAGWNGRDDSMPFLMASRLGLDYFIDALAEHGLDLDAPQRCGKTLAERALVEASTKYAYSTVYNLLEKPVTFSTGALTEALSHCQTSDEGWRLANILLHRGADVTASGILERACFNGDLDCVKRLLERGAQVNAPRRQDWGSTILGLACYRIIPTMLELLLSAGADVNAPVDDNGTTALQRAANLGHMAAVKILMAARANVNAPPGRESGRTALQWACERGDIPLMEFLLQHGANVNLRACPKEGVTALQAAAIQGYIRIAQRLISAGADIGAAGSPIGGRTAINGAAEWGRLDMVKFLLDNHPLKEGGSLSRLCEVAARYARKEYHWHVVDLLENYQRGPNSEP